MGADEETWGWFANWFMPKYKTTAHESFNTYNEVLTEYMYTNLMYGSMTAYACYYMLMY